MSTDRLSAGADAETMRLLTIYLNDHLTGATLGMQLVERMAAASRRTPLGPELERLASEISQDRGELLRIMRALGVRPNPVKVAAAWLGEKAGRLKLNGSVLKRSALSPLLELEMMHLAAEGKASGWRTLRAHARRDNRLDPEHLEELRSRAQDQSERFAELKKQVANTTFGS